MSLLSLSTISAGVFLGAPMSNQPLTSYPGKQSARGAMSGSTSERDAVDTANAPTYRLSRPQFTNPAHCKHNLHLPAKENR